MMPIREVSLDGKLYRGPMSGGGACGWKINVYRHSGKMSKSGSGLRVGKSWQCWERFSSYQRADEVMASLERMAADFACDAREAKQGPAF